MLDRCDFAAAAQGAAARPSYRNATFDGARRFLPAARRPTDALRLGTARDTGTRHRKHELREARLGGTQAAEAIEHLLALLGAVADPALTSPNCRITLDRLERSGAVLGESTAAFDGKPDTALSVSVAALAYRAAIEAMPAWVAEIVTGGERRLFVRYGRSFRTISRNAAIQADGTTGNNRPLPAAGHRQRPPWHLLYPFQRLRRQGSHHQKVGMQG